MRGVEPCEPGILGFPAGARSRDQPTGDPTARVLRKRARHRPAGFTGRYDEQWGVRKSIERATPEGRVNKPPGVSRFNPRAQDAVEITAKAEPGVSNDD